MQWNNRISLERHSRDKDSHSFPDCRYTLIPEGRIRNARSVRKTDRTLVAGWLQR